VPFTPFHIGVGIGAKAIAPRLISIQVFALTQVAMDVEPGVRMARGYDDLHGWTHTFLGSLPVALACVFAWKMLEGRRIWRWTFEPIKTSMLWLTAFVGTLSHVLLDSLIHRDMASTRTVLGLEGSALLPHETVQLACLMVASGGAALLAVRFGLHGCTDGLRSLLTNLRHRPGWFGRAVQTSESTPPLP